MLKFVHKFLQRMCASSKERKLQELPLSAADIFKDFTRLQFSVLLQYCRMHNVPVNIATATSGLLRNELASHILSAECFTNAFVFSDKHHPIGCLHIARTFHAPTAAFDPGRDTISKFRLMLTHLLSNKLSASTLKSVLQILEIPFHEHDNKRILRQRLQKYNSSEGLDLQQADEDKKLHELRSSWPVLLSASSKQQFVQRFQEHTSSKTMRRSICASCSSEELSSDCHIVSSESVNLSLLKSPNTRPKGSDASLVVDHNWLDGDCIPPVLDLALPNHPDVLLDHNGGWYPIY
ncbi:MAG: hypothetical protein NXY57DRAFT_970595 [Lentinula lateritia]|nr:MAG: hypothetical protein NXY57DRAFT_970595 [Lentinula lateritia]